MQISNWEEKLLKKIVDYRRFANIFLLLTVFILIGWMIPGQIAQVNITFALLLLISSVGSSVACLLLSIKSERQWQEHQ